MPLLRRLAFTALAMGAVAPVLAQPADLSDEVRASIEARLAVGDQPSIVVGIVDADGPRVYPFGVLSPADSTAPDANTLYEIGSITKVFTGLLLADAAERGTLVVDDPVGILLPDSVQVTDAVSLAHLASHVSGWPRMPTNLGMADPANPYAAYGADDLHAFLHRLDPAAMPGERYQYSNLGAGLLGHVLARQAGTSYDALVQERIAGPLGLAATSMTPNSALTLAPGHSGGRQVSKWTFDALAGAGALLSTPADLLRLLAAHLDPAGSPLEGAMALATAPRVYTGLASGDSVSVGLGWHDRQTEAGRIVWHNGGTGGYRSFAGYLPEARRGVVVLTNGDTSVDDLGYHLLDPSLPLSEIEPVPAVAPEVLAGYVGTYRLAPGVDATITTEYGRLYAQITGQPAFRIYPRSDARFYYTVVEAEIEFTPVEGGQAPSLTLFQNGMELPAPRVE
ncbi:MAG: serine hydrolase [Bacteroidota bacterium]